MVDQTLHVMLIGLLSLVQTKHSHHIRVTLHVRLHIRFVLAQLQLVNMLRVNYALGMKTHWLQMAKMELRKFSVSPRGILLTI